MGKAKVYRVAFEKEKELTDRALKLAEIGKPKSNWELQGVLGFAVFGLRRRSFHKMPQNLSVP